MTVPTHITCSKSCDVNKTGTIDVVMSYPCKFLTGDLNMSIAENITHNVSKNWMMEPIFLLLGIP